MQSVSATMRTSCRASRTAVGPRAAVAVHVGAAPAVQVHPTSCLSSGTCTSPCGLATTAQQAPTSAAGHVAFDPGSKPIFRSAGPARQRSVATTATELPALCHIDESVTTQLETAAAEQDLAATRQVLERLVSLPKQNQVSQQLAADLRAASIKLLRLERAIQEQLQDTLRQDSVKEAYSHMAEELRPILLQRVQQAAVLRAKVDRAKRHPAALSRPASASDATRQARNALVGRLLSDQVALSHLHPTLQTAGANTALALPTQAEPILSLRLATPEQTLNVLQSLAAQRAEALRREQRRSQLAQDNAAAAQHAVAHEYWQLREVDEQLVRLSLRLERLRSRAGGLDLVHCPTLERDAARIMADKAVAELYHTIAARLQPRPGR